MGITSRSTFSSFLLKVNRTSQRPNDGICHHFLIKTGSPGFDKVALSLSSICLEMENLVRENEFIRLIHSYGEGEGCTDPPEQQVRHLPLFSPIQLLHDDLQVNCSNEFQLARFLPVLRRMAAFTSRCGDAIQLAVSQVRDWGFCLSATPSNIWMCIYLISVKTIHLVDWMIRVFFVQVSGFFSFAPQNDTSTVQAS